MHPDIIGEIADARLADRRREAERARRILEARAANAARNRTVSRLHRLGAWASAAVNSSRPHGVRRGLRGAR